MPQSATTALPPGCTAVSKSVFLFTYDDTPSPLPSASDPDIILIYGWGSASLKNVSKFASGYHALFPSACILVILTTIFQAIFSPVRARVAAVQPVLDAAFPPSSHTGHTKQQPRILAHALSNSGIVSFLATLLSYKRRYGTAMPHQLFVCDSAPGGASFRANCGRWSRALAHMASPWWVPPAALRAFWVVVLTVSFALGKVFRPESLGLGFRAKLVDGAVATKAARRLYLYSKEDELVGWEDVEAHAAESRERGYGVEMERFEGSGHVEHMRTFPERYWGRVRRAWEDAVKERSRGP